jgi:phosphatidylglycerol:prolipoprotein diacylglycerol transferase
MFPILFESGPVKLHSFGLMLVIGLLLAMVIGRSRAERYGLTKDQFVDASFWGLILGILGARFVYIAQEWDHFSKNPSELWSIQFDGITSFGGLIFGAIGLWAWSKIKKVPFLAILDTAGAAFLIAHAVGRIGCLLNGCCFGTACDLPWGIPVSGESGMFHPAQVYDALMNVAAYFLLTRVEKKGLRLGQSFGLFLMLHGLARFIYEFWRAGTVEEVNQGIASSTRIPGMPITEAQVMALVLVIIGVVIFGVRRHAGRVEAAAS